MLRYALLLIGLSLLGLRSTEPYSSWLLAGCFAGLPLHPLPIQLQVTTSYRKKDLKCVVRHLTSVVCTSEMVLCPILWGMNLSCWAIRRQLARNVVSAWHRIGARGAHMCIMFFHFIKSRRY
jgi:hypothetical protein